LFGKKFGGFPKEAAAAQYLVLDIKDEATVAGSSADNGQNMRACSHH
jgi:hypothetical protein